MLLRGKTAIITGAAQGLGLAIGQAMIAEGAYVYFCDIQDRTAAVENALENTGGAYVPLDVTSESDWMRLMAQVTGERDRLDVLVNNAGINIRKTIEEMAPEELDRMMAVNIKGPFLGTKHAIPTMRRNGGGCIINMSSVCGLVGHRYTPAAYTTTKGAVTLLTKSVAVRYAADNIRVNSIHPSTVDTPLVQEMFKDSKKKEQRLGEVPLGRLATAEDVASAAVYLASDKAAFLNGTALSVDGGVTAY